MSAEEEWDSAEVRFFHVKTLYFHRHNYDMEIHTTLLRKTTGRAYAVMSALICHFLF